MITNRAFVSVYKQGAEHRSYGEYKYPGVSNTTLTFTAPRDFGNYEMRLYNKDGGYSDETFVMSVPFIVADPHNANITLDHTSYRPGATITVAASGLTDHMIRSKAFVSVYKQGAEHKNYGEYKYPGTSNATLTFTAPRDFGNYEMRLYNKDGGYSDETFIMAVPLIVSDSATTASSGTNKPTTVIEIPKPTPPTTTASTPTATPKPPTPIEIPKPTPPTQTASTGTNKPTPIDIPKPTSSTSTASTPKPRPEIPKPEPTTTASSGNNKQVVEIPKPEPTTTAGSGNNKPTTTNTASTPEAGDNQQSVSKKKPTATVSDSGKKSNTGSWQGEPGYWELVKVHKGKLPDVETTGNRGHAEHVTNYYKGVGICGGVDFDNLDYGMCQGKLAEHPLKREHSRTGLDFNGRTVTERTTTTCYGVPDIMPQFFETKIVRNEEGKWTRTISEYISEKKALCEDIYIRDYALPPKRLIADETLTIPANYQIVKNERGISNCLYKWGDTIGSPNISSELSIPFGGAMSREASYIGLTTQLVASPEEINMAKRLGGQPSVVTFNFKMVIPHGSTKPTGNWPKGTPDKVMNARYDNVRFLQMDHSNAIYLTDDGLFDSTSYSDVYEYHWVRSDEPEEKIEIIKHDETLEDVLYPSLLTLLTIAANSTDSATSLATLGMAAQLLNEAKSQQAAAASVAPPAPNQVLTITDRDGIATRYELDPKTNLWHDSSGVGYEIEVDKVAEWQKGEDEIRAERFQRNRELEISNAQWFRESVDRANRESVARAEQDRSIAARLKYLDSRINDKAKSDPEDSYLRRLQAHVQAALNAPGLGENFDPAQFARINAAYEKYARGQVADEYESIRKEKERIEKIASLNNAGAGGMIRSLINTSPILSLYATYTGATDKEIVSNMVDLLNPEIGTQAFFNSLEEIARGESWGAMGIRAGVGILTGGSSEMVFAPAQALYAMKDYVNKGGDSAVEAFLLSTKQVLIDEITGRAIEGAIGKVTNKLKQGNFKAQNEAFDELSKTAKQKADDLIRGQKKTHTSPNRNVAFEQGQDAGRMKAHELNAASLELSANPGSAAAKQKFDDAMMAVQGDKYAQNAMNRFTGKRADKLRGEMNNRMTQYIRAAEENAKIRIAQEYGVTYNIHNFGGTNVQTMRATGGMKSSAQPAKGTFANKPGTTTLSDAQAPPRMHPDDIVIDPSKTKTNKISFDNDETFRVKQLDPATGKLEFRDVPEDVASRIYNEEWYKAHHKGPLPTKTINGKVVVDDTAIRKFAKDTDQTVLDFKSLDAYGSNPREVQALLSDIEGIKYVSDVEGLANTMNYKGIEWINKADDLAKAARFQADPARVAIGFAFGSIPCGRNAPNDQAIQQSCGKTSKRNQQSQRCGHR